MNGARMEREEWRYGWPIGWEVDYPDVVIIECPACFHLSVRDMGDVEKHVCPGCSRGSSRV